MFFLHALEGQRQEFIKSNNQEALRRFPIVFCFERSGGPGGVWRAKRSHGSDHNTEVHQDVLSTAFEHVFEEEKKTTEEDEMPVIADASNKSKADTTNMYEALWSNGSNQSLEFADYTFDEHFGHALPVFLPRHEILEYFISRCLKRNPAIFDGVNFNTSIEHVEYDDDLQKFRVTIREYNASYTNSTTNVRLFDKCIWAAGENGKVKIPTKMRETIKAQGFRGPMVHSSDSDRFEENVRGKRVLLVGGGYSGEDLALMACKTGAEKVYITSRRESPVVTWTTSWPGNRVEVLAEAQPIGANGPNSIEVQFVLDQGFDTYIPDPDTPNISIDVDTIIFCTGYESNQNMLHPKLTEAFRMEEDTLDLPHDWKPAPNGFDEILGRDVPPGEVRWYHTRQYYRRIYRNCLIDNPNMMFCYGDDFDIPLLGADIVAHLFAKIVTDQVTFPSKEEMLREVEERAIWEVTNLPFIRYDADRNYRMAMIDAYEPKHDELWYKIEDAVDVYMLQRAGELQEEADYPGPRFGTPKTGLTATGKAWIQNYFAVSDDRGKKIEDPEVAEWRTFRDVDDPQRYKSLVTGTPCVPLKKRWMDIDNVYDSDIIRPDDVVVGQDASAIEHKSPETMELTLTCVRSPTGGWTGSKAKGGTCVEWRESPLSVAGEC